MQNNHSQIISLFSCQNTNIFQERKPSNLWDTKQTIAKLINYTKKSFDNGFWYLKSKIQQTVSLPTVHGEKNMKSHWHFLRA